ncbi:hypothetical protein B0H13DRAFT_1852443 [Mycena leptocephala]|nr:hypothetical protein B0H13DRAFT_1852443 [Mycena leptocephala]
MEVIVRLKTYKIYQSSPGAGGLLRQERVISNPPDFGSLQQALSDEGRVWSVWFDVWLIWSTRHGAASSERGSRPRFAQRRRERDPGACSAGSGEVWSSPLNSTERIQIPHPHRREAESRSLVFRTVAASPRTPPTAVAASVVVIVLRVRRCPYPYPTRTERCFAGRPCARQETVIPPATRMLLRALPKRQPHTAPAALPLSILLRVSGPTALRPLRFAFCARGRRTEDGMYGMWGGEQGRGRAYITRSGDERRENQKRRRESRRLTS